MSDKKIISLLPAATEIVCALGLEKQLVGRSYACDYPAFVAHLPVCSSTRLVNSCGSRAIDGQVKAVLSDDLTIAEINQDLVTSLAPDVLITGDSLSERWTSGAADTLSLKPQTLSEVFESIRKVAVITDAAQRGEELIGELEERVEIIRHKLKFIDEKPGVACIGWLSPLRLTGSWLPELVAIAGGKTLQSGGINLAGGVEFKDILAQDPEIIVIMPCGFTVEQTLKEINLLLELEGWADLAAVKNNRLYIADGRHYFNRPGPRIVDSLEMLAEIIHPKQFIFGFEGEGWIKFNA